MTTQRKKATIALSQTQPKFYTICGWGIVSLWRASQADKMSLQRLQRQCQAFDGAMETASEIKKMIVYLNQSLAIMAEPMRESFMQELLEDTDEIASQQNHLLRLCSFKLSDVLEDAAAATVANPTDDRPTPSEFILSALKAWPRGITLPDIVQMSRGKFRTASKDPDHVIRTILGKMREKGEVIRGLEGMHYLPENAPRNDNGSNEDIPF